MTWPVAILAGGLATRLGAAAAGRPKILIDVGGKPFAEHQIARLRAEGVTRVVYCVGHLASLVKQTLGDGRRWGMEFSYVDDGPVLLGTGGALRQALPVLGDVFFVMYGDSYLTCPFEAVAEAFERTAQPALMTVFRNEGLWDRSNVLFRDGRIVKYDKRAPSSDMRHIDYGLGVLTPGVFDRYPPDRPLDLALVYRDLVDEGRLAGHEVRERFYEIGSPEGLAETRALLGTGPERRS